MQQLTEMDTNFLQQESARTPMHISPVIVYDQSARAGGKVRFKEFLKRLKEIGFDGELIIEREISGDQQSKDIAETVEYLKGLLCRAVDIDDC